MEINKNWRKWPLHRNIATFWKILKNSKRWQEELYIKVNINDSDSLLNSVVPGNQGSKISVQNSY